jgi:hypothetical protein
MVYWGKFGGELLNKKKEISVQYEGAIQILAGYRSLLLLWRELIE